MRQKGKYRLGIFLLVAFFVACAPTTSAFKPTILASATVTRISTRTFSPTVAPTKTPNFNPIIPPLTSHEWDPEPILISFGEYAGDGGVSGPPELTLLGNGELYVYDSGELHKTQLPRQEVCKLLNTIDQFGFFVYDPTVINRDLMGDGGGEGYMDVNAWQSQHFGLMDLEAYVNGEVDSEGRYSPPILPPIVETYNLLQAYRPTGLETSYELRDVLYIRERRNYDGTGVVPWPDSLFSISDYYQTTACADVASRVLNEREATRIFELELFPFHGFVSDKGQIFQLELSYLMPWQSPPACAEQLWPPNEVTVPDLPESISCSPEDGVIDFP